MDPRYFVQSLGRGLGILETIASSSHGLTLTEVASKLGLGKTTAFGFLYTLEQLGYLERDPNTKVYVPGLKVLDLGFAFLDRRSILQIARPYLRSLSEECGVTTDVSVRDGTEIVTLALEKVWRIVEIGTYVGTRLPVYCTASGKAQLMGLGRDELRDLLGEGPYPILGPNTITGLDALVVELNRARANGFASTDEELAAGLCSVAAPIRDREQRIVAALCMTAPTAIKSLHELEKVLAPKLVHTAQQISLALSPVPERS